MCGDPFPFSCDAPQNTIASPGKGILGESPLCALLPPLIAYLCRGPPHW
jgi:hypothetical protein